MTAIADSRVIWLNLRLDNLGIKDTTEAQMASVALVRPAWALTWKVRILPGGDGTNRSQRQTRPERTGQEASP